MRKILFLHIAFFAVLLAACNGAAPDRKTSDNSDSTTVNWHRQCMNAYLHIQDHYFAGEYDSFSIKTIIFCKNICASR